jgi:curved DNA-binding protein CbpA
VQHAPQRPPARNPFCAAPALQVTVDATDKQIQQAYRLRSLKHHPDRKGGSTASFQRINQAFQTLSDPEKRASYDQGNDVKKQRGSADSDDSEEDEEHTQSLREEIERKYYPERYDFWPFGALHASVCFVAPH